VGAEGVFILLAGREKKSVLLKNQPDEKKEKEDLSRRVFLRTDNDEFFYLWEFPGERGREATGFWHDRIDNITWREGEKGGFHSLKISICMVTKNKREKKRTRKGRRTLLREIFGVPEGFGAFGMADVMP